MDPRRPIFFVFKLLPVSPLNSKILALFVTHLVDSIERGVGGTFQVLGLCHGRAPVECLRLPQNELRQPKNRASLWLQAGPVVELGFGASARVTVSRSRSC